MGTAQRPSGTSRLGRIAALRRSSPELAPQVPTLVAAEFAILAVEGLLMTVTATVGGLWFAAWAGADKLRSVSRWGALRRRARARVGRSR